MKVFAITCKILAGIIWVGIASLKIGSDITGRHSSDYRWVFLELVLLLVLAFLAVAPNRWFVVSWRAFVTSLLFVLLPFCVVVAYDWMSHPSISVGDFFRPVALANATITFGPLPISLTLSFWRQQRGERVRYA
jgi:hypothetical protein